MIKTDFHIEPDDEEFKKVAGPKIERILKSERNRKAYEAAKADLLDAVTPKAAWNCFKIKDVNNGKVVLEDNTEIGSEYVQETIRGAHYLLVVVITIGDEVECRAKKYMKNGKMFHGILLDSFGSWATDSVRKQFASWIRKKMHSENGFRTSIALSPGETKWPLQGQSAIFDLLSEETAKIGVRLRESLMMLPIKSLSFVIGTGPDKLGKEKGMNCQFCELRQTCRYQNMRASNEGE